MADILSDSNTMDDNILLHLAVIEENLDVVRFLVKHGVPVNGRAPTKQLSLQFLTDIEHKEHLKSTLGEIVKTEGESDDEKLESVVAKTTTALHLAARQKTKDLCQLLLVHGAEINAEMEGGETPLMVAVISKRQAIVELFISLGANVNASTSWGKSALHYAAQFGQKSILDILLSNGGHINAATVLGHTPLHLAAEAGHKDVVALLLSRGANFDQRTKKGATALHFAVMFGHVDIVDLLIAHGMDINIIMTNDRIDLRMFKNVTKEDEDRMLELIDKYTVKKWFSWSNSVFQKLYKKTKRRESLGMAFDTISLK